jgi:hypothetical protein
MEVHGAVLLGDEEEANTQQGEINVFNHKTRYNFKRNCYKQTSETKHCIIFQKF